MFKHLRCVINIMSGESCQVYVMWAHKTRYSYSKPDRFSLDTTLAKQLLNY